MIIDMNVRLRTIQVNNPTKHPIRLRKKNTTGWNSRWKQVQEIEQARKNNCERGN